MWVCISLSVIDFFIPKNKYYCICTKIHLEIGTCTIYVLSQSSTKKTFTLLCCTKKNLWTSMLQENYFLQNEILSMNLPLHAYIFAAVSFLKENTFLLKCFHYLSQSLKLQSISEEDRTWENHIQNTKKNFCLNISYEWIGLEIHICIS